MPAPGAIAGLIFTHGLAWALLNVVASGLSPLSLWLLGLSFFLRLTLAMTVGAQVLGDHQVLPTFGCCPSAISSPSASGSRASPATPSSGAASASCSKTESCIAWPKPQVSLAEQLLADPGPYQRR